MEPKKLRKSNTNKMIAGVCGGVAEFLNVDPTIVRLIWACFGFAGAGVIAYIVALIIMPQ